MKEGKKEGDQPRAKRKEKKVVFKKKFSEGISKEAAEHYTQSEHSKRSGAREKIEHESDKGSDPKR